MLAFLPVAVSAHESSGRIGHKEAERPVQVEGDLFIGPEGYWHAGLGAMFQIDERRTAGITTHVVREESGGSLFQSLGAEFTLELEHGIELEAFSFGYFPVQQQDAWAVGGRVLKSFEPWHGTTLGAFFSPVFARVRAEDTVASQPASVDHTMFFGGLMLERGPVEISVFGSGSVFSRNPSGLESVVDLEEMTHRSAYENNDGFARYSGGVEIDWAVSDRLGVSVRYAAIDLPDVPLRHSTVLGVTFGFGERFETFAGVQFLRGGSGNSELLALGFTARF